MISSVELGSWLAWRGSLQEIGTRGAFSIIFAMPGYSLAELSRLATETGGGAAAARAKRRPVDPARAGDTKI